MGLPTKILIIKFMIKRKNSFIHIARGYNKRPNGIVENFHDIQPAVFGQNNSVAFFTYFL